MNTDNLRAAGEPSDESHSGPEYLPSQEYDRYWIHAFSRTGNRVHPGTAEFTGKWMPFVTVPILDETWAVVREATVTGKLGASAKTATMKDNPNARGNAKVMCIYTYDYRDIHDVRRILAVLRELGFSGRLNYKEDNATSAGLYANRQDKIPVSLYTSPAGDVIKVLRNAFGKDGQMTVDAGKPGAFI